MNCSTVKEPTLKLFVSVFRSMKCLNTTDVSANYSMSKLRSILDVKIGDSYLFVIVGANNVGECHYYMKVYDRGIQGFTTKFVESRDASLDASWENEFTGTVKRCIANNPLIILPYEKIVNVYSVDKC